jgi:pilus assembly protein CpaB
MRQLPGWVWLVLAIAFAGMASYMALGWLKGQANTHVAKEKTSLVVVATANVGPGTSLVAKQLKTEVWHQPRPPRGSFGNVSEVVGRVTASSLAPGELVMEDKLTPKGTIGGITALLSPDKRAMTVRVDEASGVAGFLVPGDRVDVVAIINKGKYDKDPISKILFQNLKVLGTGQKIEARPNAKPQVVPTVTLEVTPAEGERLALAVQTGRISLVLRRRGDHRQVNTPGIDAAQLLGNPPEEKKPVKGKVASLPPTRTVEVIRGLQRQPVNY